MVGPDFYNWNKARVRYCDGSSFTGDVEAVDPVSSQSNQLGNNQFRFSYWLISVSISIQKTNLHYRGNRIFRAMIDQFKSMGLSHAKNVRNPSASVFSGFQ